MQLIHQAVTLDLKNGQLLIGDNKGHIIRSIYIKFPEEALNAYRLCIKDVHQGCFGFIHEAILGEEDAENYITSNLKMNIKKCIIKQSYVDYDCF